MAQDDPQGRKSSTEKKLKPTKNKKCFGAILSWRISQILSSLGFPLFLVAFLQTDRNVLCFSDATQHQQLWGSNCTWAILIPIWGWTPDPWTLAQHPTIYIFLIFPWLIPNQNVSINFQSENDPNQAEASLEATSLERKQLHWAHSCHSPALWPAQRITSVFAKCFSLVPEVSLWKPPPAKASNPSKKKKAGAK